MGAYGHRYAAASVVALLAPGFQPAPDLSEKLFSAFVTFLLGWAIAFRRPDGDER
jgi:hypothetical protein